MKVLLSASFSVPRCSRPMCGSARCTTSPSSSSTKRNTPCAAGCCGPKFSVKLRISAINRPPVGIFAHDARGVFTRLDRYWLVDHSSLIRVVAHLDIARNREILAERVPNEAVIGQDTTQIVVTHKSDTVQVESLSLEPVGIRPESSNRIDCREAFVFRKNTYTQTRIQGHRQQMDNNSEAQASPRTITVRGVIDATQIDQLLEAKIHFIAQCGHYAEVVSRADLNCYFTERQLQRLYLVAEMLLQVLTKRFQLGRHIGSALAINEQWYWYDESCFAAE